VARSCAGTIPTPMLPSRILGSASRAIRRIEGSWLTVRCMPPIRYDTGRMVPLTRWAIIR
jgi:hypothetical protein